MKTLTIMNFERLAEVIADFEKEFLKEGEKINDVAFTDSFGFTQKQASTWGTDTISHIDIYISNNEVYGSKTYKNTNLNNGYPNWKLIRENMTYK
jgi:hypothetical protein